MYISVNKNQKEFLKKLYFSKSYDNSKLIVFSEYKIIEKFEKIGKL